MCTIVIHVAFLLCNLGKLIPTSGFFCAFGPKLRSSKNSGFRQNSGISGQNSGIFPQKLRYSETFFSVYYIIFFKNSGQIGKTQVKVRKTQVFGNKWFLFEKKCTKKPGFVDKIASCAGESLRRL